jgi:hypothetical protein
MRMSRDPDVVQGVGAGVDRGPRGARGGERGTALLVAVATASILVLGLISGYLLIETSSRSITGQLRRSGQAANVAEAGLTDALAWFQRQTTQPVTSFAPVRNLSASPPINDTENASIGIVRTYPVSLLGNIWARYEVRISNVSDVSIQRGKSTAGTIWSLESDGILFRDANNNQQFTWTDGNSNGVYDKGEAGEAITLAKQRVDIQRLSLVLPGGNAAIQGSNCAVVRTNQGTSAARVLGSNAGIGIACKSGTGTPTTTGTTVTGSPAIQSGVNPFNVTIPQVFGVSQSELIGLANLVVSDAASVPSPIPAMSLIVVQGNATFTTAHPLVGSGILVVLGNLTIPASSTSSFNGVIYVTGNYSQGAPALVRGAVVGQGNIYLVGAGDVAEVDWDSRIVQQVRNTLGGYRFARTSYVTQ